MLFKDKESFVNYTQIIPAVFIVIWIVMTNYVDYVAPRYPDETDGRIYQVKLKTGNAYLTRNEEILMYGSLILAPVSIATLLLISSYLWKDEDCKRK